MIQQGLLRGFIQQEDLRDVLTDLLLRVRDEMRFGGFVEEGRLAVGAVARDEGTQGRLLEVFRPR